LGPALHEVIALDLATHALAEPNACSRSKNPCSLSKNPCSWPCCSGKFPQGQLYYRLEFTKELAPLRFAEVSSFTNLPVKYAVSREMGWQSIALETPPSVGAIVRMISMARGPRFPSGTCNQQ
jgi:hypothetical protein